MKLSKLSVIVFVFTLYDTGVTSQRFRNAHLHPSQLNDSSELLPSKKNSATINYIPHVNDETEEPVIQTMDDDQPEIIKRPSPQSDLTLIPDDLKSKEEITSTENRKSIAAVVMESDAAVQEKLEDEKAEGCAKMVCIVEREVPVCACNYVTGNVVSFKNHCDVQRHNCRFDTKFHVILPEICPWEFYSRRSNHGGLKRINYDDPKYYNK